MNPATTVLLYALAAIASAAIIALCRYLYNQAKSQRAIHEVVLGRPASQGVPAILSMTERFDNIATHLQMQDAALVTIEHEVMENNGSSIKDTVNATNAKVTDVANRLDEHIASAKRARRRRVPAAKRVTAQ